MKKIYHFSALIGTPSRIFKLLGFFLSLIMIFVSGFGFSAKGQETIVETFTSSDTWTVPAGVTEITVEAWGAGGGGGNRTSNGYAGGGGGGAYSRSAVAVSSGQSSYIVTIGQGGTSGVNGGSTIFGLSEVVAAGGKSVSNNNQKGAQGGLASESIGDVRSSGGNGGRRRC